MMHLFRRIWNWIFYPRNELRVGASVGGESLLVFDGCVHIGGEFTTVKDVPDYMVRWDGTAWAEASRILGSPTITDGVDSGMEFEAQCKHVNDYSRPITYWDLKDRWHCAYCASMNMDADMECRKCGAPRRET